MPSCTKYIIVFVALMACICQDTTAAVLRPFQTSADEKARQEVMRLAARIFKLSMYGGRYDLSKRNGGTLDSLLNFPDLSDNGRR